MANDKGNAVVGKPLATGGVLVAPVGTALPTDETTALNVAFKAVGYIADDGVTKTESRDSDTIKAWGGDTIAALQKSFGVEWKFKLAEFLNDVVQKAVYGAANVTITAATASTGKKMHVIGTSSTPPHNTWVFEIRSDVASIRIVVPDAVISDTGDVTFKDDELAVNDVTLTSFPDASGAYFHVYTNDGRPTP
jgi:hypothetical protein